MANPGLKTDNPVVKSYANAFFFMEGSTVKFFAPKNIHGFIVHPRYTRDYDNAEGRFMGWGPPFVEENGTPINNGVGSASQASPYYCRVAMKAQGVNVPTLERGLRMLSDDAPEGEDVRGTLPFGCLDWQSMDGEHIVQWKGPNTRYMPYDDPGVLCCNSQPGDIHYELEVTSNSSPPFARLIHASPFRVVIPGPASGGGLYYPYTGEAVAQFSPNYTGAEYANQRLRGFTGKYGNALIGHRYEYPNGAYSKALNWFIDIKALLVPGFISGSAEPVYGRQIFYKGDFVAVSPRVAVITPTAYTQQEAVWGAGLRRIPPHQEYYELTDQTALYNRKINSDEKDRWLIIMTVEFAKNSDFTRRCMAIRSTVYVKPLSFALAERQRIIAGTQAAFDSSVQNPEALASLAIAIQAANTPAERSAAQQEYITEYSKWRELGRDVTDAQTYAMVDFNRPTTSGSEVEHIRCDISGRFESYAPWLFNDSGTAAVHISEDTLDTTFNENSIYHDTVLTVGSTPGSWTPVSYDDAYPMTNTITHRMAIIEKMELEGEGPYPETIFQVSHEAGTWQIDNGSRDITESYTLTGYNGGGNAGIINNNDHSEDEYSGNALVGVDWIGDELVLAEMDISYSLTSSRVGSDSGGGYHGSLGGSTSEGTHIDYTLQLPNRSIPIHRTIDNGSAHLEFSYQPPTTFDPPNSISISDFGGSRSASITHSTIRYLDIRFDTLILSQFEASTSCSVTGASAFYPSGGGNGPFAFTISNMNYTASHEIVMYLRGGSRQVLGSYEYDDGVNDNEPGYSIGYTGHAYLSGIRPISHSERYLDEYRDVPADFSICGNGVSMKQRRDGSDLLCIQMDRLIVRERSEHAYETPQEQYVYENGIFPFTSTAEALAIGKEFYTYYSNGNLYNLLGHDTLPGIDLTFMACSSVELLG